VLSTSKCLQRFCVPTRTFIVMGKLDLATYEDVYGFTPGCESVCFWAHQSTRSEKGPACCLPYLVSDFAEEWRGFGLAALARSDSRSC